MNRKQCAALVIAVLSGWLMFVVVGCSRGYKTGSSITPADLAKAMPEFPIKLPPGGTNLYLERDSRPPLLESWLKVAVPVSSLTNFLRSFGFLDEFIVAPPQMIRSQRALRLATALQLATDTRSPGSSIGSLAMEAYHSAEWDVGTGTNSMRLYFVARPGMSSPNDRVVLFGYVDGTATNNATVYLEYHCLQVPVPR
jgi:hypothetical protein